MFPWKYLYLKWSYWGIKAKAINNFFPKKKLLRAFVSSIIAQCTHYLFSLIVLSSFHMGENKWEGKEIALVTIYGSFCGFPGVFDSER